MLALGEPPVAAPQPPRVEMPEPQPVPKTTLKEVPRRPYYGQPRPIVRPGLRIGVGLGARLAGPPADRAHFALDVLGHGRFGLHRGPLQAILVPTLGYSLGAGKVTREHLLVAGLGLGLLDRTGGFSLVPALLVGSVEGTRALGVRTSLLADFTRQSVVLELAHQALFLPAGIRHELRLLAAIDLRGFFVRSY